MKWLSDASRRICSHLKEYGSALLIHHDDADGITSAAIIKKVLDNMNITTRLICLEKLYPQVLDILSSYDTPIIFVDLGSPHVDLISNKLKTSNTIVVIDHHDPSSTDDPRIIHVNPELFGISGESEASASTIAYLLARESLHNRSDAFSLSPLALIGSSEIPGEVRGLNKMVLDDAIKNNLAKITKGKIEVFFNGRFVQRIRLSTDLTILGSVGYYKDGPQLGIEACISGMNESIRRIIVELRKYRMSLYRKGIGIASRRIKKLQYIQWVDVGPLFYNVGAKVLGTFLSFLLHRSRIIDDDKYLVGAMNLNPKIPGLGRLDKDYAKVSMRVPKRVELKISEGTYPPASKLLANTCSTLGGFADGHAYAASGIVPLSRKSELLELLDQNVKGKGKENTLDRFLL